MKMNRTILNLLGIAAVALPCSLQSQLLYDGFNYTTGNTLGANNWSLIGGSGGSATNVVAQNLSRPGYAPSIGNAVNLGPNGQDWFRSYTTQTYTTSSNASLYYSFLMRVDSLGALDSTGGLFVSLADGTGNAGQTASVWLRSSGAGYQIGVSKRNGPAVFDGTVFSTGTTVLLAASYNLVSGPINNDTASLWINPTSYAGTPPAATLTTPASGLNDDILSFSTVVLRPQGPAGSTQIPGSLIFDEVRVGTSWGVAVIPEPSTVTMVGLGLAVGLYMLRRRQRLG